MTMPFPKIHVGSPLRHQNLVVFPLFTESGSSLDYRLSDDALSDSAVVVHEVGEEGSVPTLVVENQGDRRVLFLEGEQLVGAKQNRILNTSILVPAKAKLTIPVSCVEQGRWRYHSLHFLSSPTLSPSRLRHRLKSSVTRSLQIKKGHHADQGAVWQEVGRQQEALGAASPTGAMADTFATHADQLAHYREHLPYPEGATGVAVVVGPRLAAVDLFDKPSTCQKVWEKLLAGLVLDALEAGGVEGQVDAGQVERLLNDSSKAAWGEAPAVGEGQEYRTVFDGHQGSALACGDSLVHMSVITAL